jgi:hypothetical protein
MHTELLRPSRDALRARAEAPRIPPNLSTALAFARAGGPIFPCAPDKHPLIPGGRNAATTDERLIREWLARWPDALASIPTGPESGLWVLDVDGKAGRRSLNALLARLGLEHVADLSRVIVRTPSGGLHIHFRLGAGETPRTRSSDIAPGLDSRGVGGSIMAPGNVLPDGRRYELIDGADLIDAEEVEYLDDAPLAPRALIFLATFNDRERTEIARDPELRACIRSADPSTWAARMDEHRQAQAAAIAARTAHLPVDAEGMRRQALHDVRAATASYAELTDGRRNGLFPGVCKVARYVVHGVLTEAEFRSAWMDAARANGALAKHGPVWAVTTIRNAINKAQGDPLPPLARAFRTEVAGQ